MKFDYDIEVNILEDIYELDFNQCFIFSDEEESLLMEVMRTDDYSQDGKMNPNLSRQRSMKKK